MTSGPKNTTHRVPWPFSWADCPPGVPPRPATGSCHVSSPCHDPVIRSLSSQRGHRADGPAKEPAPRTRANPAGLVPGTPLHPGGHGVMDLSRAGHLCRRLPVRVPLVGTSPPARNLPVPSLGAPGLCCCRQWDWRAGSRGKESPRCPVEMAEFPKVGQVNFLTRADLLVTMDIAQLYTNNPP